LKAADYFPTAQVTRPLEFRCSGTCSQKELTEGQDLILVAAHVMSKESPDWLWSTFWWKAGGKGRTSGKSWTCDNAQREDLEAQWAKENVDAATRAKWSNYSTNVTTSFSLPRPAIDQAELSKCGAPGRIGYIKEELLATYNPFVEGVMENGRKSNCIVCHARASTRGDSGVKRFRVPAVGTVRWPPVTEFEGHIRTDYLWTLANHIGLTNPKPNKPPPAP
jgi:hypothetical protein